MIEDVHLKVGLAGKPKGVTLTMTKSVKVHLLVRPLPPARQAEAERGNRSKPRRYTT